MAATAAADSDLSNWVMLERFIFRRDDPKLFREDKRTFASGTTSAGTHFDVTFILAEPPTPSRLYLSWPKGPKQGGVCHLVAAHRNLVLLRLDYLVDESQPFGEAVHDYFIYIADPSASQSQRTPSLTRLPQFTEHDPDFGGPSTRALPPIAVGLLCHGEDEFAVAHLAVVRSVKKKPGVHAELCVLRSSLPCCDDANWETKLLPIQHQLEYLDFVYWVMNGVVPFENSLCWVDYCRGIMFCDGIFEDSPKVSYIRFPLGTYVPGEQPLARKGLYRSLCVTKGGRQLVYVDVTRHDGRIIGPMAPNTGFTLTSRTLMKSTENSTTQWKWIEDAVVTSGQLWDKNTTESLPRGIVMLPLLSADKPNVAHVVLFDWVVGRVSLVTIDLSDKQVMGSVVTYIKGCDDDLSTDDADLVKAKPSFFVHFLPSEFPKFLNLRKRENHP